MPIQLDSRVYVRRTNQELRDMLGTLLQRQNALSDAQMRTPAVASTIERMTQDSGWQILKTTGPEVTSAQFTSLTYLVFRLSITPIVAAGAPVPHEFERFRSTVNCQIQIFDNVGFEWLPWIEFAQESGFVDGNTTPRIREIVVSPRIVTDFLPPGFADGRFRIAAVAMPGLPTFRAVTSVFWTNIQTDRVTVTSSVENA